MDDELNTARSAPDPPALPPHDPVLAADGVDPVIGADEPVYESASGQPLFRL